MAIDEDVYIKHGAVQAADTRACAIWSQSNTDPVDYRSPPEVNKTWCLTSTENIRLIRGGEKGGGGRG